MMEAAGKVYETPVKRGGKRDKPRLKVIAMVQRSN
jgi:hypothetical protein